jgi:hypothetical protein
LITVLITESQRLKERLYKTKVGRAYQQRVNFFNLKIYYMSHEEFLKILVTKELLDEYEADFLLCKELEGGGEEEEEEEDEE